MFLSDLLGHVIHSTYVNMNEPHMH